MLSWIKSIKSGWIKNTASHLSYVLCLDDEKKSMNRLLEYHINNGNNNEDYVFYNSKLLTRKTFTREHFYYTI